MKRCEGRASWLSRPQNPCDFDHRFRAQNELGRHSSHAIASGRVTHSEHKAPTRAESVDPNLRFNVLVGKRKRLVCLVICHWDISALMVLLTTETNLLRCFAMGERAAMLFLNVEGGWE